MEWCAHTLGVDKLSSNLLGISAIVTSQWRSRGPEKTKSAANPKELQRSQKYAAKCIKYPTTCFIETAHRYKQKTIKIVDAMSSTVYFYHVCDKRIYRRYTPSSRYAKSTAKIVNGIIFTAWSCQCYMLCDTRVLFNFVLSDRNATPNSTKWGRMHSVK